MQIAWIDIPYMKPLGRWLYAMLYTRDIDVARFILDLVKMNSRNTVRLSLKVFRGFNTAQLK